MKVARPEGGIWLIPENEREAGMVERLCGQTFTGEEKLVMRGASGIKRQWPSLFMREVKEHKDPSVTTEWDLEEV